MNRAVIAIAAAGVFALGAAAPASATPGGITVIAGTSSDDNLLGDAGSNAILAHRGADLIGPGDGADYVSGGRGSDFIDLDAPDGQRDVIYCGNGLDFVQYEGRRDRLDVVSDSCEVVDVSGPSVPSNGNPNGN